MKRKKAHQNFSVDFEQVDKWLKDYFLDPYTTHCDLTQFRIDLYETDDDWIVEAVLNEYKSSDITVKVENKKLLIYAQKIGSTTSAPCQKRFRIIDFPFPIINHHVNASFENGILEIFISKTEQGIGKDRYITLP
ncbi:Hsp20/alpha crystallin family protein [Bacillus sp. BRMEA1]|uniref:Hsp20/alpha crystallin family protein n=1 Tax=Neobacillus endophyticus TaxID=2738405 RepID=UPI001564E229|nr:Hsp20 family protein [Neobacillus endophyticus]NRD79593.1 Hsp20/alpha crystallin family protein [Neobacillus endophyticus]